MKLLSSLLMLLLISCTKITEPEQLDISGRYQCADKNMILLLEHFDRGISATLEWDGISTNLEGKFDFKNMQVIMNGLYYGAYQISFNLIYGSDKSLRGGYVFSKGTQAVSFEFVNRLKKHNQGGINGI
jgi:hypothetical protein